MSTLIQCREAYATWQYNLLCAIIAGNHRQQIPSGDVFGPLRRLFCQSISTRQTVETFHRVYPNQDKLSRCGIGATAICLAWHSATDANDHASVDDMFLNGRALSLADTLLQQIGSQPCQHTHRHISLGQLLT